MGFFNYVRNLTIAKKDDVKKGLKAYKELTSLRTSLRPSTDNRQINNFNRTTNYLSRFGMVNLGLWDLYYLATHSDILQLIFTARSREIFRNGFNIEPVSSAATEMQEFKVNSIIKRANNNGQSLKEVLQEWSRDLDWADDAYLLVLKDYLLNPDEGTIVGGDVKEVLRLDPLSVEMVLDSANRLGYFDNKTRNMGESVKAYFKLSDRSVITEEEFDEEEGVPNLRAHYKVLTEDGEMYYNNTEILHKSDFNPTATYGFSPLYSYYNKIITLMGQDEYIRKYYIDNKPLKGVLAINTTNKDGLYASFEKLKESNKQNPHDIHPFVLENKNGNALEYINMSQTLVEMQFTEARTESRNLIGAAYGVSPIFQNDVSTSGGLNNEGLQITVTNRAVEDRQELINTTAIPFIFEQMGITQYEITLKPSEEQDDIHELDKERKELENAKLKLELGLKGRMEGDAIIFEEGALELEQPTDEFIPFSNSQDEEEVVVETPVELSAKKEVKKVHVGEGNKFKKKLDVELEKIVRKLDLKKKPTEQELTKIVDEAVDNLEKQLKVKSANRVKAIYRKEAKKMAKQLKLDSTMSKVDKNAIEALKRDTTFQESFKGMSLAMNKRLREVISKAYENPKNFTIDKIVSSMKEELDKSNSELRNIARTETGKISAAARKNSYTKGGGLDKFVFRHIGPNNERTTSTCKRIMDKTKNGVSWDDYVRILKQESKKDFPEWKVNKDAPLAHYMCRHTVVGKRIE